MSDARKQTERMADRLREEFLTTLKELDRRRHQATNLQHQLEAHLGWIEGLGVGVVLLLGAGVGVGVLGRRYRRRHALVLRGRALLRAWEHPERLATNAKERPLPLELGRKVLTAFLVALATRLARNLAMGLFAGVHPPRPAPPSPPSFLH